MKQYILPALMATILSLSLVAATGPIQTVPLIGPGDSPYTESEFVPLIFLNEDGGRILENEAGWVLPGENGNVEIRNNNYIFTGEQIIWEILVWDKNGVPDKINDVYAGWAEQLNEPVPPEAQVNCHYEGPVSTDDLAGQGYSNVRRPGDQEAQEYGNPDTMGIYSCVLTIEPSCHGQKWVGITAVDVDENEGQLPQQESWFCNPALDLGISGDIEFGELGPGEQSSSTFSVENMGEQGSGVEVVLAISGKDFYDPDSSGAMCPTTNQLALQGDQTDFTWGFWYTAVMGSHQTDEKRIPYGTGTSIAQADPIFSTSSLGQQWREWKQNELVPMSPGSEATMTLYLGLPQPCNGEFTDGQIDLFAWAI